MIDKNKAKAQGFNVVESGNATAEEKQEKLAQLKQLMPGLVNADGQVDVAALRDFVDIAQTTANNKGYELTFAGKGLAKAEADTPTEYGLHAEKAQSKDFDNTGNVVIRGDNIDALKILYQNYHQKIKMIYIDPPYNTKSGEFVYKDNFKKSESELIEELGLEEETTDFLQNVYGTRSHSGWLAFMYPRLKLARELLTDDGVIFISIDDNEQASLKVICDEIFGEENFKNSIIVRRGVKSVQRQFSSIDKLNIGSEYVLVYVKSMDTKFEHLVKWLDEIGDSSWNNHWRGTDRPTMRYEIFGQMPSNGQWRWKKGRSLIAIENYKKMLKDLGKDENSVTQDEIDEWYLNHENSPDLLRLSPAGKPEHYIPPPDAKYLSSLWSDIKPNGGSQLKRVIGFKAFDTVKSMDLLERLIQFGCGDDDKCIILDFFAGSGTTGDAVLRLNAEDGGARKFILVQLDEKINKNKSPESWNFCTENDLAPVISSICIERLNRAGKKIKESAKQQALLENNGEPDVGYKVFSLVKKPKLTEENPGDTKALFRVTNKRKFAQDTLINMLCATGVPLHAKTEEIIKDKLYQANNEIFVLADIPSEQLEQYKNQKINIDGFCKIDLENYLNLDIKNKENITIVY